MSTLTLIRHAQATPFEEVTDRLSSLGETQAEALGRFWARQRTTFDAVYSGSLERHRRTAEIAGRAVRSAGLAWPEVTIPKGLR